MRVRRPALRVGEFALSAVAAGAALAWRDDGAAAPAAWARDAGRGRALACGAGVVCGVGNGAQFLGGSAVGFATADLVQV